MYYAAKADSDAGFVRLDMTINSDAERPDYLLFDFPSEAAGNGCVQFTDGETISQVDFDFDGDEIQIAVPSAAVQLIVFINPNTPATPFVVSPAIQKGCNIGRMNFTAITGTMTMLKYKIEMPANSKVNLFEEGFGNVAEIQYNLPVPNAFAANTFFQAVSTNGFEFQDEAQAGQQTITLLPFLSGRYAVSAEFWTYNTAQTIWLASAQATLEDYSTKAIVPTAGTGGTIVTALPQ